MFGVTVLTVLRVYVEARVDWSAEYAEVVSSRRLRPTEGEVRVEEGGARVPVPQVAVYWLKWLTGRSRAANRSAVARRRRRALRSRVRRARGSAVGVRGTSDDADEVNPSTFGE